MDNNVTILAIVGVVIVLLVAWLAWRRLRSPRPLRPPARPPASGDVSQEAGERLASPAAEQIEEMVRSELDKHPGLGNVRLDFGTEPGGGLEIWVGDARYGSVEEIPDERIRKAIAEAVAKFNR